MAAFKKHCLKGKRLGIKYPGDWMHIGGHPVKGGPKESLLFLKKVDGRTIILPIALGEDECRSLE